MDGKFWYSHNVLLNHAELPTPYWNRFLKFVILEIVYNTLVLGFQLGWKAHSFTAIGTDAKEYGFGGRHLVIHNTVVFFQFLGWEPWFFILFDYDNAHRSANIYKICWEIKEFQKIIWHNRYFSKYIKYKTQRMRREKNIFW